MPSQPSTSRTSTSHPLAVGWISDLDQEGRLGLCMAPGRRQRGVYSGISWQRDAPSDLKRLREHHGVDALVCLLEPHEHRAFGHGRDYAAAVRAAGMSILRLPIADGATPADAARLLALVVAVDALLRQGMTVVVHCAGGYGRAGTVVGCALRLGGSDAAATFAQLAEARGPHCPESAAQRRVIAEFQPAVAAVAAARGQLDRRIGAVLGAAVGDAMGHPTEFLDMAGIHRRFGPDGVSGFELWWTRDGQRFAPYTDDTQMAEVVLTSLLDAGHAGEDLDATMRRMAAGFVHWMNHPQGGHRAPGGACLAGCRALQRGVAWREAGGATAGGCGSVMRAWPFGLVFAEDPDRAEAWAVAHSALTHRDPIALAACAAMARGVAAAVTQQPPPTVLTAMVEAAARHCATTSAMIRRAIDEADAGVAPGVTLDRLRAWAAHEAIAACAYLFARHPDDPRAAILAGANTPGDSDSIATLAGALVGARCGAGALPAAWRRDVERAGALVGLATAVGERLE